MPHEVCGARGSPAVVPERALYVAGRRGQAVPDLCQDLLETVLACPRDVLPAKLIVLVDVVAELVDHLLACTALLAWTKELAEKAPAPLTGIAEAL